MRLKLINHASLLGAVALLTGCPSGGDDDGGGARPTITAFAASPTEVSPGGTTTLSWTVDGATNISITAMPGGEVLTTTEATGSVSSNALSEDTTFTLSASNAAGTAAKMVTVTVTGDVNKPQIDSFTATPMTVGPGEDVVLAWETTNATAVDIAPGVQMDGSPDGTVTVQPQQTTTYTLTAKGEGTPATMDVTVTVTLDGPTIDSFAANPATVTEGDSSDLTWSVSNATNVTVTDDGGTEIYNGAMLQNTVTVTPAVAAPPGVATYTLVATDADGASSSATAQIMVNPVGAPVIDSFTATPDTIDLGLSADLAWGVSNATEIEIQTGGMTATTSMSLTGTYTVTPTATSDYVLIARDANGMTAMDTVTVTVNAAAPPILQFDASPNPVAQGGMTTLSYQTASADTVRILEGQTELLNTANNSGTVQATVTASVAVYTIEATNAIGTNTQTLTVYGHDAPVINDFQVGPTTFPMGGSAMVTIDWDVTGAATLTLMQDGAAVAAFPGFDVNPMQQDDTGTFMINVNMTTTFELIATSAAGMVTQSITVSESLGKTEPNDDAASATPLPNGGTANGEINPGTDEDWYMITVAQDYSVRAETSDGAGGCPFDTTLTLTSTDGATDLVFDDDGGTGTCSLIAPPADQEAYRLDAGTYYISVGSYGTNTGQYVLNVELIPPGCGNGLVDTVANETCDDGNTTNGDGCDGNCMLEVNPTVISGAGGTVSVNLAADAFAIVQVDLATDGQSITATAADAGGLTCDVVDTALGLLNSQQQLINAKVDGGPTGTAGDCASIYFPQDAFATNLTAGSYYLAVFNENMVAGSVDLTVSIVNPTCGDTVVNPGETCDDGNTTAGDGCDATCQVELAGTFVANPGATQTFTMHSVPVGRANTYGITVNTEVYLQAETFSDSTVPECTGIDTVIRLLDSGAAELGVNDQNPAGGNCSYFGPANDYTRLQPGTYFVTVEDWLLDDAITYDLVLEAVTVDICGNGVVDGANEGCDDGNTIGGDGCDASCQPEAAQTEIEPNDSIADAMTNGDFAGGNIDGAVGAAGDFDFFQFTLPGPASAITATTMGSGADTCASFSGGTIDSDIALLDATGTELATNDDVATDNWCSTVTVTNLAAGTYYVRVRSSQQFAPSGTFSYRLQVSVTP